MSLLDKFKEQFTDRDDEYEDEEYEEEGTSIDTAQPVPPRPAAGRAAVATRQAKPYTMVVVNPKDYQDAEKNRESSEGCPSGRNEYGKRLMPMKHSVSWILFRV